MSKSKPKVLESEDENEEEETQANKILGDKQIEASASTDDITPMETRENVKLHIGHDKEVFSNANDKRNAGRY
jgi:hypothetical protein